MNIEELNELNEEITTCIGNVENIKNRIENAINVLEEKEETVDITYIEERYTPIGEYTRSATIASTLRGVVLSFSNGDTIRVTFIPAVRNINKDNFYVISIAIPNDNNSAVVSFLEKRKNHFADRPEVTVQEMPDFREPRVKTIIRGKVISKQELEEILAVIDIDEKLKYIL